MEEVLAQLMVRYLLQGQPTPLVKGEMPHHDGDWASVFHVNPEDYGQSWQEWLNRRYETMTPERLRMEPQHYDDGFFNSVEYSA